jgi:hypothetical protein
MTEVMSPTAFKWFLTILTASLAGFWAIWDTKNLIRARHLDRSDPIVRDRHFGYVIGIIIGVVGVIGALRFHDVL